MRDRGYECRGKNVRMIYDSGPNQSCYLCLCATTPMKAGGLGYWKCRRCGLIARRDLQSDERFIGDTYSRAYYVNPESYPQWDTDPQLKEILPRRVLTISKLKPTRGRLLDVGSGLGHFMAAAQVDGWDVTGVEPSAYARKIAQNRTGATIYDSVFDLNQAGPFDCVTLWDVLEHDPAPLMLLRRLRDVMAPDALLCVSMPNHAGLEARLRGKSWRFFRSEYGHMMHYTPNTLALILGRASFDVAQMHTEGSLNVSNRLKKVMPGPARDLIQRGSDRAASSMRLGRNLTAYAWCS